MIERLAPPVSEADLRSLALLLVAAVDSGAAVSFLTITEDQALDWWRRQFSAPASGAIVLAARDAEGIVGAVQLHPARAPNQPHRADVAKLIVHRRARRRGLGERLYCRIGWSVVGTIPRYALDTDGATPHDTVVFYKELPA